MCGDTNFQFSMLWENCNELKRINLGTTTKMKTKLVGGNMVFERLYICFDASKKGFIEGCRPTVGQDGFHLKGIHKG